MGRWFTAIVVGAFIYVVGCFFSPNEAGSLVVFVPIGAVIFTTLIVTIVVLPLREILYRCFPLLAQRTTAAIAASLLIILVTALSQMGTSDDYYTGRLSFWTLGTIYVVAITSCLFWPLSRRLKDDTDKNLKI